jgi:hypothetical protein
LPSCLARAVHPTLKVEERAAIFFAALTQLAVPDVRLTKLEQVRCPDARPAAPQSQAAESALSLGNLFLKPGNRARTPTDLPMIGE